MGVSSAQSSTDIRNANATKAKPAGGSREERARLQIEGPVAQRLEQGTHNPLVGGSNPSGPTNFPDSGISVNHCICLIYNE
jgi:hypothetical protein